METPAPVKPVETPAPEKEVETPAPAEPEKQLPTPEAVKDVVKDLVETIHNDQEGDADGDVNLSPDAPGPTLAKPVDEIALEPHAVEEVTTAPESQDTEGMESDLEVDNIDDEEQSTSKLGIYQGVTYNFVGTPTDMVLMSIPKKKGNTPVVAGECDGEDVIIDDEYLKVHEMMIEDEDQEEIIWK